MWWHSGMIDFPVTELLDDTPCAIWLEPHRHPDGLQCPHCGNTARRLFHLQRHAPAYRYRLGQGSYTLRTGTIFERTRQRPTTLVLRLLGIANGEPPARLPRELVPARQQLHILSQRIQPHLHASPPVGGTTGAAFEADERYQNAGEQKHPAS
jgi:hypothetical protein